MAPCKAVFIIEWITMDKKVEKKKNESILLLFLTLLHAKFGVAYMFSSMDSTKGKVAGSALGDI